MTTISEMNESIAKACESIFGDDGANVTTHDNYVTIKSDSIGKCEIYVMEEQAVITRYGEETAEYVRAFAVLEALYDLAEYFGMEREEFMKRRANFELKTGIHLADI